MASADRKRRKRHAARKGGERARKTNAYPLRKVVSHFAQREINGVVIDAIELECGHLLSPPEDFGGRRYPQRMRCFECARADLQGETDG